MGFDQLMSLVPSLVNQRNAKVSKATVLQKSKSLIFYLTHVTDTDSGQFFCL